MSETFLGRSLYHKCFLGKVYTTNDSRAEYIPRFLGGFYTPNVSSVLYIPYSKLPPPRFDCRFEVPIFNITREFFE